MFRVNGVVSRPRGRFDAIRSKVRNAEKAPEGPMAYRPGSERSGDPGDGKENISKPQGGGSSSAGTGCWRSLGLVFF